MPAKGAYLAIAGGGAILLWSGVRGKSWSQVIRNLIAGKNPATTVQANPIGAVASSTDTGAGGTLSTSGLTGATGVVTSGYVGNISNAQQAQSYAFGLFSKFGWGASEEQPLINLWNQESGWNPDAVNPSSGAAGIPQALGHGNVFGLGWANAAAQILWGLNYIKQRYGSPSAAWAHEVANNWY